MADLATPAAGGTLSAYPKGPEGDRRRPAGEPA